MPSQAEVLGLQQREEHGVMVWARAPWTCSLTLQRPLNIHQGLLLPLKPQAPGAPVQVRMRQVNRPPATALPCFPLLPACRPRRCERKLGPGPGSARPRIILPSFHDKHTASHQSIQCDPVLRVGGEGLGFSFLRDVCNLRPATAWG